MNYIEIPSSDQGCPKHLRQGRIAILADAIGSSDMIEFCCRQDHDVLAVVADTILMLDIEKWIRGLPSYAGAQADRGTMRLSPVPGVNITFDRHVMTVDGFMTRQQFIEYKVRKRIEVFREMSREGKLYVARSSVNGGEK